MKTVNVKNAFTSDRIGKRSPAYVAEDGDVLVYDDVAGYYTRNHRLTDTQRRYVIGRTKPRYKKHDGATEWADCIECGHRATQGEDVCPKCGGELGLLDE